MDRKWWKESVVYQIYPASFMDSDGDGIGDIKGIISKLDYIKDLGVDIIWVSPIYQSPNDDNGYDISDYEAIQPQFGTMSDFDNLLNETHKRGMKLVMDLVVNHSSDEHRWFVESKKSKDNPYRDFYIWKDGKENGTPPNNWTSYFSGSAWEYDEKTQQYYLHMFTKKQPDLNWENPAMRKELYKMLNFWFEKGIDGFRIDVLSGWAKTPGFPDGKPKETGVVGIEHFANVPRIHDYVREMNREVFSHYDCVTIGETSGVTVDDAQIYTNPDNHEVNMVFQFEHVDIGDNGSAKWFTPPQVDTLELKGLLSKWQKGLDGIGWNSLYMSNHDQPRQVSRFGDDKNYWLESAKMLATLLHLQQGTPFVFQGEELGMTNTVLHSIEEVNDVEVKNAWKKFVENGNVSADVMMAGINCRGRDNARTPMQWNAEDNAGFTHGKPWLAVNPNYVTINAEAQKDGPNSVLSYYKKLIAKRKETPVVVYGDFKEYYESNPDIFVFTRSFENKVMFTALNLTSKNVALKIPGDISFDSSSLYISNYSNDDILKDCTFRPYEAIAYILE